MGSNLGQRKQTVFATQADDIVIIAETEDNSTTIEAAKKIGFRINEDKTKCMIVSRREYPRRNAIKTKDLNFERVLKFKYLGVDVNAQSDNHEEIHRRIKAGNRCNFALD